MPIRDLVVVGGSSGGIEALSEMLGALSRDLRASVCVVQHLPADSANQLPDLLARKTDLPVSLATDGQAMTLGHVYVAPADFHLVVESQQTFLSHGPRENRTRPAVDPLFRSAALARGSAAVGVVLSGALDDGTAGMVAIKRVGGTAMVQDPDSAVTPDMPRSAMQHVEIDHCLNPTGLAGVLQSLAGTDAPATTADVSSLVREVSVIRRETGDIDTALEMGELAPLSCPDCGGPLWEIDDQMSRFRCHTGHAFTARHLLAGLQDAQEQALWVALRTMQERSRMLHRIANNERHLGRSATQQAFQDRAKELDQHIETLSRLLDDDS